MAGYQIYIDNSANTHLAYIEGIFICRTLFVAQLVTQAIPCICTL